ncbi:phage tail protein [Enterobacter hormaechei]|nr:phage tail protein [Enterobacter hormaechei]
MATTPTQKPVPSESPIDLKYNAGKIDEFVTSLALQYIDRFGNAHYTIEGLRKLAEQAIAAFGWIPVDSFQEGATLTLPNQILRWKLPDGDGEYYRWDGAFPKVVDQDSTPETSGGIGPGEWVSVGDAALRSMLAASNGALMVGGAILECSTVAFAQSITGLTEGRKVRTYYYNVPVVTDWIFTTTQPAAPTFYITAVGGYLVLMTPNFASAGIIPGDYDPQIAWGNRNKITKLYLDTRFSVFTDGCSGEYHILGSIVPNRSFIKTILGSGFVVVGHYDDPAVPESVGKNTGAMFDFTLRGNYHTTGDYANTGVLDGVLFEGSGDYSTVFNSVHSQLHNNNVIGAYNIKNSSVKVFGRITGSDHRGINFDGLADNCYAYVADVAGCSNEAVVMRPSTERYCSVHIGSCHNMAFDGTELTVLTTGGGYVDAKIEVFRWNGTIKPVLARSLTGQGIKLKAGRIYGVVNALRQYETPIAELNGGTFSSTTTLLAKVTPGGSVRTSSAIRGVTVLDSLTNVYSDESGNTKPYRLEISDCDLVRAGASAVLFAGKTTTGTPEVQVLKDNNVHASMVTAEWNLYTSAGSTVTLTGTSASVPVSRNYSFCTIAVNDNSTPRRVTIDLRAAEVSTTGFAYVLSTNAGLTATYGSNSVGIVVTGTAVNLLHYVLHN